MRKFAKTLAVVGVITPAGVNAIGVGEIKLHSALNQRLLAEIPLRVSSGEDVSQIRVNLAPSAAFGKAGLPRPYYLSNLRFKPTRRADGSVVIQVTSNEVIREPFLDFLLEVDWPQGRMLREFTVLLDPPITFEDTVRVTQAAPSAASPSAEPAAPTEATTPIGKSDGYGPVQRNESLWSIANQLKPDPSITTEQMAMALFKTNPDAFLEANVNALKAGVTLKQPNRETLIELSPAQARREFRRHYDAWMATRTAGDPAATESAQEQENQAQSEARPEENPIAQNQPIDQIEQGQLKLEVPAEEELESSQVEVPVVESPSSVDSETQALVESLQEENQALRDRLEALEEQIAALVEIKSARMQALQQPGEDQAEKQGQAPEAVIVDVEEGAEAVAPSAPESNSEETEASTVEKEPVAPVEEQASAGSMPAPVEPSEKSSGTSAGAPGKAAKPDTVEPKTKDQSAETKPSKPAPKAPEPPRANPVSESPSFPGEMLDEPFYLSLGGGSLILLGIAGWMIWRRRQAAAEQADSLLVEADSESVEGVTEAVPAEVAPGMGGMEVAENSFLSEFTPSDFDILEGESASVDPIAEADVYLAYGRYQQAEDLIKQVLDENPKRSDLRLKLLEIFYAKEDSEAYDVYAQELQADGADQDTDFWEKVAEMGRELCPQSSLFAEQAQASAPSNRDEDPSPAVGLDDKDSDSGLAREAEAEAGLDFDLAASDSGTGMPEEEIATESDQPTEQQASETEAEDEAGDDSNGLDFDLGDLDLESVENQANSPESREQDENADGLAFDFDLDSSEEDDAESKQTIAGDDHQETQGLQEDESSAEDDYHLSDLDELDTKLDLARAYVDMEDVDAAKEILEDVFSRGSEQQKEEARTLLDQLGLAS
ncbi:FimV/HubP family polar landmark protein [Methylohalobius crimeensis]|uniref:FimV/HubP family polar landmark protein n=1 Tax=Methylohalobius crimeensis TaxID=244365 RepID=UPI0003B463EA|nr:FimV/HubP family polar landmark protein [Methylohalobius crimeensis]